MEESESGRYLWSTSNVPSEAKPLLTGFHSSFSMFRLGPTWMCRLGSKIRCNLLRTQKTPLKVQLEQFVVARYRYESERDQVIPSSIARSAIEEYMEFSLHVKRITVDGLGDIDFDQLSVIIHQKLGLFSFSIKPLRF